MLQTEKNSRDTRKLAQTASRPPLTFGTWALVAGSVLVTLLGCIGGMWLMIVAGNEAAENGPSMRTMDAAWMGRATIFGSALESVRANHAEPVERAVDRVLAFLAPSLQPFLTEIGCEAQLNE